MYNLANTLNAWLSLKTSSFEKEKLMEKALHDEIVQELNSAKHFAIAVLFKFRHDHIERPRLVKTFLKHPKISDNKLAILELDETQEFTFVRWLKDMKNIYFLLNDFLEKNLSVYLEANRAVGYDTSKIAKSLKRKSQVDQNSLGKTVRIENICGQYEYRHKG